MLAQSLKDQGVTEAWVGNFHALLHRDMASVNEETVRACKQFGQGVWKAVGCVNPKLPDWKDDLRRCIEDYQMFAIRIHPNYHSYKLTDAECLELLGLAAEHNVLVQMVISMEDERTQHPLLQVARVDHRSLGKILQDIPQLRVMVLNMFHGARADAAASIWKPNRVWFDFATLEGVAGLDKLVTATGPDAVCYGSFAPLFYPTSAELKLVESGLPASTLEQIRSINAKLAALR